MYTWSQDQCQTIKKSLLWYEAIHKNTAVVDPTGVFKDKWDLGLDSWLYWLYLDGLISGVGHSANSKHILLFLLVVSCNLM